MSKKQRRKQNRRAAPPTQSVPTPAPAAESVVAGGSAPAEAPVQQRRVAPALKAKAQPTWQDFAERYRYVNRELKQIGILAGSFLVVLLILTAILG